MMNPFFMSELQIPVRRYHNTFDDFFMNRFHDISSSFLDTEMTRRLSDWRRQLDSMKDDLVEFSPNDNAQGETDDSQTVSKNPAGKPEFAVQLNVKNFKPDEVKVATKNGKLEITGCHEEKDGTSKSRREFKRLVALPKDVQVDLMKSVLSEDGILSVTAPIKPPQDDTPAVTSSGSDDQQALTANSTTDSSGQVVDKNGSAGGKAVNYSLNVAGFLPQEVSVTVDGRRVKVHAKHDEIARGRKSHNEMTRIFELPPVADSRHVRSFINNDTLYIEAQLRDNLEGETHVIPVEDKAEAGH